MNNYARYARTYCIFIHFVKAGLRSLTTNLRKNNQQRGLTPAFLRVDYFGRKPEEGLQT